MSETIVLPEETCPVRLHCDVCVIGGSCTGLFAAVRAARLGASVAIVEKQNHFGGVAVSGLVCMWHTLYDRLCSTQIIGGLTLEMLERLERRNAVSPFRDKLGGIAFNPQELTLELDRLAVSHRLHIYFDTRFRRCVMAASGKVDAVVVEDGADTFAIRAKVFVDASGDGTLCRRAGLTMRTPAHPQPASACMNLLNMPQNYSIPELVTKYRSSYPDLPSGYGWGTPIPGSSMYMLAATRILSSVPLTGEHLSAAELESRAQAGALLEALRDEYPDAGISLQGLPSALGLRETFHIQSLHQVTGEELMSGEEFPDTIGNGTYPTDIHDDASDQMTFRYLDGRGVTFNSHRLIEKKQYPAPAGGYPTYYRIPLRSLIPTESKNIITAGRMIDADRSGFGALRVMVNLNQCGEAAGVAAALMADQQIAAVDIPADQVRAKLVEGGSILL